MLLIVAIKIPKEAAERSLSRAKRQGRNVIGQLYKHKLYIIDRLKVSLAEFVN